MRSSLIVVIVLFLGCSGTERPETETTGSADSAARSNSTADGPNEEGESGGSSDGTIRELPDGAVPATGGTTPVAAAPPNASRPRAQNVLIDSVEAGNPLVLKGRARTFENNVALRVRDARGVLISESFTTATGEMGQFSPWSGSLWLTRDPGDRVTVEALEYSAKDGSEQSLVSLARAFTVEPVEARLYFPDSRCTEVAPFNRRMPKSISHLRLLVEALIAGPVEAEKRKGAVAPFPSGSRVRSVNLRDGVATIDFNERLQNVGGSCQAQMIRKAVTRTLLAVPTVKKVVITAEGSEKLALQP